MKVTQFLFGKSACIFMDFSDSPILAWEKAHSALKSNASKRRTLGKRGPSLRTKV